ncbi:MAG: TonB-dependent receptor domain-containing protein [Gemmatimonadales bacterium]
MSRMSWFGRLLAALGLVLAPGALVAQQETGRLVGRVVEGEQGTPLAGAMVEVTGTSIKTATAVDGRFILQNVPVGAVSLSVRLIGFQPKTVTGLAIAKGETTEQNVSLSNSVVQLQELAVTAEAERGTVNAALEEQRNATALVNSVTSEQIAKSPDSDASQAVQRVSGVTVQDGKYVFVRGLGERYTTATLNGARIPSPEPERKVVPLDLFPSALLEAVTTSKTFTPDQTGDFAGAQVNIKTKEFPSRRTVQFSVGTGFNSRVAGNDMIFPLRETYDPVAFGAGERALPSEVANTDFTQSVAPTTNNGAIASFRNAWSTPTRSGAGNANFGLSVGGTDKVFGQNLGYVFSGNYGYGQEIRDDQYRGLALAGANGAAEQIDLYQGQTGRYSVLWGGIANITTNIGTHSQIAFNNTYNRTMDNDGRREQGFSENLATALDIQRLRYVERSVFSTQLQGTHALNLRHRIDWAGTFSDVSRKEPDRSELVYTLDTDPVTGQRGCAWYGGSNEAAVRTFGDLHENAIEGKLDYTWYLGASADGRMALKLGGLARSVDRDAINDVYSISSTGVLPQSALEQPAEVIFDGRYTEGDQKTLRLTPLGQGGSYVASDRLLAGYAMISLPVSRRLTAVAGARLEDSRVVVDATPTLGETVRTNPTFTDVLPSLSLTYALNENQNLRFAASRTLSRPEYRELAPLLFREVIGSDNVLGNAGLQRTLIDNLDLRWEWFLSGSEILSVSAFAKRFHDPIERVYLASSGTRIITFVNAKAATNYGVEFELRKGLGSLTPSLAPFTVFSNLTLMQSEIEIDNSSASVTDQNRRMVGQAPYVVNVGTTYTSPGGNWSGTLLWNVVGERITEAGELPLPNVTEKPRHILDLSLRFPVVPGLRGKLDVRNILDSPFRVFQGSAVRDRYLSGRQVGIGFTWNAL